MVITLHTPNYFWDLMMTTEEDSKNLLKRRSRLTLKKFVSGNKVVDAWNGLSDSCINCSMINDFKSKIKIELEPEM